MIIYQDQIDYLKEKTGKDENWVNEVASQICFETRLHDNEIKYLSKSITKQIAQMLKKIKITIYPYDENKSVSLDSVWKVPGIGDVKVPVLNGIGGEIFIKRFAEEILKNPSPNSVITNMNKWFAEVTEKSMADRYDGYNFSIEDFHVGWNEDGTPEFRDGKAPLNFNILGYNYKSTSSDRFVTPKIHKIHDGLVFVETFGYYVKDFKSIDNLYAYGNINYTPGNQHLKLNSIINDQEIASGISLDQINLQNKMVNEAINENIDFNTDKYKSEVQIPISEINGIIASNNSGKVWLFVDHDTSTRFGLALDDPTANSKINGDILSEFEDIVSNNKIRTEQIFENQLDYGGQLIDIPGVRNAKFYIEDYWGKKYDNKINLENIEIDRYKDHDEDDDVNDLEAILEIYKYYLNLADALELLKENSIPVVNEMLIDFEKKYM